MQGGDCCQSITPGAACRECWLMGAPHCCHCFFFWCFGFSEGDGKLRQRLKPRLPCHQGGLRAEFNFSFIRTHMQSYAFVQCPAPLVCHWRLFNMPSPHRITSVAIVAMCCHLGPGVVDQKPGPLPDLHGRPAGQTEETVDGAATWLSSMVQRLR